MIDPVYTLSWSSPWTSSSLLAFILVFLTSLLTLYISHKVFSNRLRRLLREARVHWERQEEGIREGSLLIESIPSGWINVLLMAVWPSLLERFFSQLASDRLQKAFQKRIGNMPNRFPWKHLMHVMVEHVTLGLTAPQFEIVLAKFDPSTQILRLEADVRWTTSGFQIVLCPVLRSRMLKHIKTRFLLSNLDLSGRVRASLHLTSDQPGIRSCELSFVDVPSIDMRISPMGMALEDVPGIPECLRGTIVKILTKGMVHPKKLVVDIHRLYTVLRAKRRGGPGGLLTITVTSLDAIESDDALELYCECSFVQQTFRTPIRSGTRSVMWDWHCGIPLETDLETTIDRRLTVKIFNARSMGEPILLTQGSVVLNDADLEELINRTIIRSIHLNSDGPFRQALIRLELQLTVPVQRGGSPHVTLSHKMGCKDPHPSPFSDPSTSPEIKPSIDRWVPSDVIRTVRTAPVRREDVYQEKVEVIEQALSRLHRRQNTIDSEPMGEMTLMSSTDSSSELTESGTKSEESASSGDCTSVWQEGNRTGATSTGFMNLLHVTKFDETLRRDRVLYRQRISQMQSRVDQLEEQLTTEQNRRRTDGIRSIEQGGRFIVHKHHERAVRYLWYDPSCHSLNWAGQRHTIKDGQGPMQQTKSQSLHQIVEVRSGIDCFPKTAGFGLGALRNFMQRRIGGQILDAVPVESNCFSIVFSDHRALNLEVPPDGNGRTRDAWMESLVSLTKMPTSQAVDDETVH